MRPESERCLAAKRHQDACSNTEGPANAGPSISERETDPVALLTCSWPAISAVVSVPLSRESWLRFSLTAQAVRGDLRSELPRMGTDSSSRGYPRRLVGLVPRLGSSEATCPR